MAGLFGNKMNNGMGGNYVDPNSTQFLAQKHTARYSRARFNFIWITLFTVFNIITSLTQSGGFYLFSAYMPAWVIDLAMHYCGKYSEAYYEEFFELYGSFNFVDSSLLTGAVVVAFVIALIYLLCFFLSGKNRVGVMITGLVFYSIDTLLMLALLGVYADTILVYAFHSWAIVELSMGISAHYKLKKLPKETPVVFEDVSPNFSGDEGNGNLQ